MVQNDTPEWMLEASETYNVPLDVLKSAYEEFPEVEFAFHADDDELFGNLIASGSQYINTLLTPNTAYDIFVRFRFNGKSANHPNIYGAGNYNTNLVCISNNTSKTTVYFMGKYKDVSVGTSSTDNNEVWTKTGSITLNGTAYAFTKGTTAYNYPIFLYAENNGGSPKWDDYFNGGISMFYIPSVILLVPFCRDNVYGMINLLADDISADSAFYKNAGKGSFTYSHF